MQKTALVYGAGGFIGGHLVTRLKQEGYWVRGVDIKRHEYHTSDADDFQARNLTDYEAVRRTLLAPGGNEEACFDEIYQLAADMGGAGYIFTGDNDSQVMTNSAAININLCRALALRNRELKTSHTRIFYSSSACVYPEHNQMDPENPNCEESSAYPANPDSEYGWEKLFSERLFLAYNRNHGIPVRIARYHNVFGPLGTWTGGREKAPAAICRKVAESTTGSIDVWGDGEQTRSFMYVDECVEGTLRLMRSDFTGPVNIGSTEMVSINQLVDMVADIAGKTIAKNHIPGPLGVRGRVSDNRLIQEKLGWAPSEPLRAGIAKTYSWILDQVIAAETKRAA